MQPYRPASPIPGGGPSRETMDRRERMTTQHGRAFNEWLRAQLKAKKMSQRQLAQQSGVDHSTISRLIRGDRMPSLGTAAKLARGLRAIHDEADAPAYLGVLVGSTTNPTARVEYALRADDLLTEAQVRQVMEYYLAIRARRYARGYGPNRSAEDPAPQAGSAGPQGQRGGPGGGMSGGSAGSAGSAGPNGRATTAGPAPSYRPLGTVSGPPRYVGAPIVRPVGRPPNREG